MRLPFAATAALVAGSVLWAWSALGACGQVSWTTRSTGSNWGAGYQGAAWIEGRLWLYDAATRNRVEGQPRRTEVLRDSAGVPTRFGRVEWLHPFSRDEPDDPPTGRGARAVGAGYRPDTGVLLWVGETMVRYSSGPTGLWSAVGRDHRLPVLSSPSAPGQPVTTWGRPVTFDGRPAPSWSGSSGLAWDHVGRRWLYATSEGARTWLVESRDDGRTWTVLRRDWWPWAGDQPPFLQLAVSRTGRLIFAGTSKFAVGDRAIKLRVGEFCSDGSVRVVTDNLASLQISGDTNIKGLTLVADPATDRIFALRYSRVAIAQLQ